ncbi:MAG: SgcJ/EcaC family oxidoreductase [Acidobacteria bacterium]|nr:SgcJ/EcaC family oxidoreductase [Acidobacteriota bacterium]
MNDDERAVRELVDTWMRATRAGDLDRVLELMAEDVVFLVAGGEPMRGRAAFAATFRGMGGSRVEGQADVQEVRVFGDWAYCWTQIQVRVQPAGAAPVRRAGPALSVLRREPDGRWVIFRDANMVAPTP